MENGTRSELVVARSAARQWVCLLLTAAVLVCLACSGESALPPAGNDRGGGNVNGGDVSFSDDLIPILVDNCAGCHSPGGAADVEGSDLFLTADVAFDMLTTMQSVVDPSLSFVVAGDAPASLLYLKVNSDDPPVGVRMPRSLPPLSAEEIELIRLWIEQGAREN